MEELYYFTILGALLHDIGKLGWRAKGADSGLSHEYFSKIFTENLPSPVLDSGGLLDTSKLAQLVYVHHKDPVEVPKEIVTPLLIIKTADYAAAAMEREPSPYGEPEEPLESIFESICICEKRVDHGKEEYVYKPSILDTESIFPEKKECLNRQKMRSLSGKLWEDLLKESKDLPLEIDKFVDSLYYLLKKYTFFTLSAGYRTKARVPLFDHLKTTAALAACLYKFCKERHVSPGDLKQKAFALVLGDASRIQDFIFKVRSHEEARKGIARRVRGRSLEVTLLMDAAAHMITMRAGVPEFNILWCTGGQFAVLIPSTYIRTFEEVSKEINKELWEKFDGSLYLSMGASMCNLIDKNDFIEAMLKCEEEIDRKKQRKFLEVLEEGFKFTRAMEPRGRCSSCGKDLESGEDVPCEVCKEQEVLGQTLLKSDYLLRLNERIDGSHFSIGTFSYQLVSREEVRVMGSPRGTLYSINSTELSPKIGDHTSRGFIFLGNAAPSSEGNILSFDYLGYMSRGSAKVGLAKGDVDNMGFIMHSGLDFGEGVKIWSYSHMSTLLEVFFAGHLNRLVERYYTYMICEGCKERLNSLSEKASEDFFTQIEPGKSFVNWWILHEKFGDPELKREVEGNLCERCKDSKTPVIYINYSGGDDFMITGPWDAIMRICLEIREDFGKLSCGNPDMGMSIGYIVMDPKHPLTAATEELSSYLNRAKGYRSSIDTSAFRKDMVCAFGDCVPLSEAYAAGSGSKTLSELLNLADRLEAGVRMKEIPRGFIHDLIFRWRNSFLDKYKDPLEVDPKDLEKRRREVRSYLPELRYRIVRNLKNFKMYEEDIINSMPWIMIPACWVSLRTRSRRE